MQSPNRSVVVNEDDNRKLGVYEQGDLDVSPSGIAMFASDANGTLRILKQDDKGNLNVNLASGSVSATIGGTMAVYFDQSAPTVNATGAGGSISVNVVAGGAGGGIAQTQVENSVGAFTDVGYAAGDMKMPVEVFGAGGSISVNMVSGAVNVGGTLAVYFDQSEPTVKVKTGSTIAVSFDPGHEIGSIKSINSTVNVQFDPGHELGSIKGINSTIGAYVDTITTTVSVKFNSEPTVIASGKYATTTKPLIVNTDGAIKVYDIANGTVTANLSATDNAVLDTIDTALDAINTKMVTGTDIGDVTINNAAGAAAVNIQDGGNAITVDGTVTANAGTGTMGVRFSDEPYVVTEGKYGATKIATIHNTDGALKIYDLVNGTVQVSGVTNTIGVYMDTWRQTGAVRVGQIDGTVAVYFSPSNPSVAATFAGIVNASHTASIASAGGSVSGSTSGVSVSGVQVIAPEANRVIKVYAFSIMSTAAVNLTSKFTNGSGGSPVELWRVAMISPTGGVAGANLAVTPPGYLFATPSGATLCIVNDSASLIHYSVAYFKESA